MDNNEHKSVKKRNRGHNRRIGFSAETVTKDAAKTLLSKEPTDESNGQKFFNQLVSEESINVATKNQSKRPKKRKRNVAADNIEITKDENNSDEVKTKPEKKKEATKKDNQNNETKSTEQDEPEGNGNATSQPDNSISKRAIKRLKHQKLLESKKLDSSKIIQENTLNYLANWKYNREVWRFEKLKQIWLIHHLYDSSRIDDECWETVVEYFANSQGKVRKDILDQAIKIIENEEIELNDQIKFKRARDIVQRLQ